MDCFLSAIALSINGRMVSYLCTMKNNFNIKEFAERRFENETETFREDFDSGDMGRCPERYFSASRGMFMFWIWEGFIKQRNNNIPSGSGCDIKEFVGLIESHGHAVAYDERGFWGVHIGSTIFTLSKSSSDENLCNIHAYTREFEWHAGMYDDSTLDTRLIDIESLLAGMEELDAVNSEIMPRFDDEVRSWKKRLMVKDIEKTTEDARKKLP